MTAIQELSNEHHTSLTKAVIDLLTLAGLRESQPNAAGEAPHANIPAFPGAEGYGAKTTGGRGGGVIPVTNLNASGTGSFKEACEAKGPRIVVFKVSGTIDGDIRISNDHITIAGQTAPGDGITIKVSLGALEPATCGRVKIGR